MGIEAPTQQKTPLERLDSYIHSFRNDIEQRVLSGTESWIGFSINKIFSFEILLRKPETQTALGEEKLIIVQERLKVINNTLAELKRAYDYFTPMDHIEEKEEFYRLVESLLD